MWEMHNLATAYAQRPSSLIGLADSWSAYQFDVAVLALGRHVEAQLARGTSIEAALKVRTRSDRFVVPRGKVKRLPVSAKREPPP